ncbi:MAG: acyl-CoA thioesterase [Candidatus Latescibacteria bacterium 4484_107]|nr:MAG: acyl-CoA thioesterase [Candidatus Latescibacteria bacterium 4484_107]
MAEPRDPAIRVMMLPRDTNGLGTIFGGIILSYLDLAGEIEARRHGPRRFVTVAMREVIFSAPVYVGDVVSFYARTVRVGRTSVTVQVEVEAERRHMTGEIVGVTKAEVVYVAVDETGKSIPVKDEDA